MPLLKEYKLVDGEKTVKVKARDGIRAIEEVYGRFDLAPVGLKVYTRGFQPIHSPDSWNHGLMKLVWDLEHWVRPPYVPPLTKKTLQST